MPISPVDVVVPAFTRMKRQLFQPFRFGQWLRLALVGFLAGEMGSGGFGGGNFNLPRDLPSRTPQQLQAPVWAGRELLFALGIGLAILLIIVLWLVLTYLNSRMRFILLDSVIAGECRIRRSWSRWGTPAFRYFVWQILFMLAAMFGILLLLGVPLLAAFGLGWISDASNHVLELVLGGVLLLFLLLGFAITFAVFQVLTRDFVVPQMAFDGLTPVEGWRRLWPMMKSEPGRYAGYIGMKILLSLAAAIAVGIVAVILFLIILIPVGGAGLVTVLAGRAAGLSWSPLTIALAIVAGAIVLALLILLIALISVPSIVFFPAYSLHFFADRYAPLHEAMYPVPPPIPDMRNPSPEH